MFKGQKHDFSKLTIFKKSVFYPWFQPFSWSKPLFWLDEIYLKRQISWKTCTFFRLNFRKLYQEFDLKMARKNVTCKNIFEWTKKFFFFTKTKNSHFLCHNLIEKNYDFWIRQYISGGDLVFR